MKTRQTAGGSAGFTLVDFLVTSLITSVILAGFVGLAGLQVSTTRDQSAQIDLQQTVRDVAEMFSREVRRAGANPTCATGFSAVEFAAPWMVRVKSDLDGNGTINATGNEDVTYQYFQGELRRIANGSLEVLIRDVDWSRSGFRYFDKDGELLTISDYWSGLTSSKRSKVRRIEFVLDLEQHTSNGETVQARGATAVSLRNRFFLKATGC